MSLEGFSEVVEKMEERSWKIGRKQMVSRILQQQKSGQDATMSTFLYDTIAAWDFASMTEPKAGGATHRLHHIKQILTVLCS